MTEQTLRNSEGGTVGNERNIHDKQKEFSNASYVTRDERIQVWTMWWNFSYLQTFLWGVCFLKESILCFILKRVWIIIWCFLQVVLAVAKGFLFFSRIVQGCNRRTESVASLIGWRRNVSERWPMFNKYAARYHLILAHHRRSNLSKNGKQNFRDNFTGFT